jgi:hypothetical protein
MQFTSGSFLRSFGFLEPQPPSAVVLSTGTDFAGRVAGSRDEGVEMPGVEGGVKAGDTRPGSSESVSFPAREDWPGEAMRERL